MDGKAKNRVRLWLRAEKAFGLQSVPAPRLAAEALPEAADQPPAEVRASVRPGRVAAAPPPPQAAPVAPAGDVDMLAPEASAPFSSPLLPRAQRIELLAALEKDQVRSCAKCRLAQTRTNTVFGEGDPEAQLFFIGEGPGENEDLSGRPFVGRAGQLLDKMIAAMGLKREQVFIGNIVKCRPPGNRAPAPDEVGACTPYLLRQLEIIRPKVIVTLGLPATRFMLNSNLSMGRLRGQWHTWRGIKLMPTFHPSYVLRTYTPQTRAAVWSDLQQVMAELGLQPPSRSGSGNSGV